MPEVNTPQPQPPAQPSAAGPGTGQPPIGSSPATGPTQNRGLEAAGAKQLGVLIDGMTMALSLLGATSEPGKDVLSCIQKLSKYVPPGSVTPADKMQVLQGLMMKTQQANQQMQQMRSQHPAGGAQPQGGQPQGGAQPAQPMPHAA